MIIVSTIVKIIAIKDIIELDNCFSFMVQKIYHSENHICGPSLNATKQ